MKKTVLFIFIYMFVIGAVLNITRNGFSQAPAEDEGAPESKGEKVEEDSEEESKE